MAQKLTVLGVALVMLFSVANLAGCGIGSDFAAYKTTAKVELDNYATIMMQKNNYDDEGLMAIARFVEAGKNAIDAAATKPAVNSARDAAKADINKVSLKEASGAFYSLQEAFVKCFLTKEYLQNIAYYHNDDSMPVYPEVLGTKIEKAIKETRATDLRAETFSDGVPKQPNATADDVVVLRYYGEYNYCFAVMLSDSYYDYTGAERSVDVAGVIFNYNNGNSILIWVSSAALEDEKMKEQSKQTYLASILKTEHSEATINDVSFRPFLGIYEDSLVAVFYGGQYHGDFPDVEVGYELEGLEFAFSKGYSILVWNNGDIYDLPAAYAQNLLTKENLVLIHDTYYNID